MAIFDLYSKRKSEVPDVYTYEELSSKVRLQVIYIIQDFLDKVVVSHYNESYSKRKFWDTIHKVLLREHGKVELYSNGWTSSSSSPSQVKDYIEHEADVDQVLDAIEITFRCITDYSVFGNGNGEWADDNNIKEAIKDLNTRLKENGIGYRFENGTIIRADNEVLHETIVKPVLSFLTHSSYKTINDEYLNAHEHFRHSRLQACITECLKAFESTMKLICHTKGYSYDQKDTASKLIKHLYDNHFIPEYLQTSLGGLRAMLEGGIPTIRNRTSGHGGGVAPVSVDEELASYTLNLTGSTIKFLLDLLNK